MYEVTIVTITLLVCIVVIPVLNGLVQTIESAFSLLQSKMQKQAYRDAVDIAKSQKQIESETVQVLSYEFAEDSNEDDDDNPRWTQGGL